MARTKDRPAGTVFTPEPNTFGTSLDALRKDMQQILYWSDRWSKEILAQNGQPGDPFEGHGVARETCLSALGRSPRAVGTGESSMYIPASATNKTSAATAEEWAEAEFAAKFLREKFWLRTKVVTKGDDLGIVIEFNRAS